MSIVKPGAYGYGGYGYGQSKPYHTTNSDPVTTVVTEISRLAINEKPPCTGATVKHASLEEVCKEKAGAYSAHHGGGTVQKHGYSEQRASDKHGSGVGGYGAAVHHDGAGAVQKHGYGEHQAYQYGGDLKGYTALHHESTVQKHGYGGQKAYGHGVSDVVGGYGHDSAVQKHGYGGQKAYQHGSDVGGYSAVPHDTTVQNHGYGGEQKAYQHGGDAGGYGALHHDSVTQKHGAYGGHGAYQHAGAGYGEHKAYQQGCVDGVGGYEDGYVGEDKTTCAPASYGKTYNHRKAGYGGYHGGAQTHPFDSEEDSDCSEDESDSEDELVYGGKHGAGSNKLGTTHQYSAYERRQNLGGGSHYESYQSTTTQGYNGGGYGW